MGALIALTVLAALLQIIFAPLPVLGFVPLMGLLVAVWFGYKYGPFSGVSGVLIVGLLVSFYSINPSLTLAAYGVAALIVMFGVSLTSDQEGYSRALSQLVVLLSAWSIIFISNIGAIGALSQTQIFGYLMLSGVVSLFLWTIFIFVADPRS